VRTWAKTIEPHIEKIDAVRTLALPWLQEAAAEYGLSRRQAEIAVLELGVLPLRYLRSYGTVGIDGQLELLRSCVAVIGLGGLGGYVVEGLARMGVGRLVLVDGDVFIEHNLNRQILSDEPSLGRFKTEIVAERVQRLNPSIETVTHSRYATKENLAGMLTGVDVVVDALDRLPTRLTLQTVAAEVGIPMVHGAIAGWVGQVMTILPGDSGLRALYGSDPVPEQGAEVEQGCPAASPMMIAAFQVHETIKVLLNKGELIRNRMLFIDAAFCEMRILELDTHQDTG
jgi:molybdopterin/thiamine biosynthesis adenylyltransferase